MATVGKRGWLLEVGSGIRLSSPLAGCLHAQWLLLICAALTVLFKCSCLGVDTVHLGLEISLLDFWWYTRLHCHNK